MNNGWQTTVLGEVCDIVNGGTPKTNVGEYWDGSHLWITPAEMGKRLSPYVTATERKITDSGLRDSSARMLPPYSVILSSRAPIGHLVINTKPMATNQGCKGLIPRKQLEYKFLYYYLSSIVDLLENLGTGATFKELSGGKLKEVSVPFPPLPEQQRIVRILDEAFDGLATAKASAEKNRQNARALFERHLQTVFTRRGEGWVEKRLGDICILRSGTTVSAALEKPAGDLPYLKVADMTHPGNDVEIVSSSRFLNRVDIGEKAVLPPGTTIFPKRGGAILTNKKRLTAVPICADLNIMGVIPGKRLIPKYLYFYFFNVDMRRLGSGSSIPQINNYDIEPLVIPFPESGRQQAEIVAALDELSKETQRLASIYQQKLTALDELKKSLLHQAFSGQL
jgi:type I restriction enzyme S subunit